MNEELGALSKKELLNRLKQDPISFVSFFRPDITLHEGQKKIIRDPSPRITIQAPRRFGKSTVIAIKALIYAFTHKNSRIAIISKSLRSALETFEKCSSFLLNSKKLNQSIDRRTLSLVELKNRSRVIALPVGNDGDALRGLSLDVLIADEAAFIPEPVFESIGPELIKDRKLGEFILISSPKRLPFGFFWRSLQPDASQFWSQHFYLHQDAIFKDGTQFISQEILDQEAFRCGGFDSDEYRREYLCEWGTGMGSFFTSDSLEKSIERDFEFITSPDKSHQYVFGIDVAQKSDFTVIIILDITNPDVIKIANFVRFNQLSTRDIINEIESLIYQFNPTRVLVDSSGIGLPIIEELKQRNSYFSQRIEPYIFTRISKLPIFISLQTALEDGILKIPNNDTFLFEMSHFVSEVNKETGHIKLFGDNAHDDIPTALALAYEAAKREFNQTPLNSPILISSKIPKTIQKKKSFLGKNKWLHKNNLMRTYGRRKQFSWANQRSSEIEEGWSSFKSRSTINSRRV